MSIFVCRICGLLYQDAKDVLKLKKRRGTNKLIGPHLSFYSVLFTALSTNNSNRTMKKISLI